MSVPPSLSRKPDLLKINNNHKLSYVANAIRYIRNLWHAFHAALKYRQYENRLTALQSRPFVRSGSNETERFRASRQFAPVENGIETH